jgi:hypothetical protein
MQCVLDPNLFHINLNGILDLFGVCVTGILFHMQVRDSEPCYSTSCKYYINIDNLSWNSIWSVLLRMDPEVYFYEQKQNVASI